MDAGNRSFSDLVTGRRKFEIPDYQRNYSWEDDQRQDLWRDLHNNLNSEKTHFFGTFLLREKSSNTYDIIDGQQRLTSVLILLNELTELWRNYDAEEADDTRKWYIANRDGYKLSLMGEDERFFKEYVLGGIESGENTSSYPEETTTPSQSRLKDAKEFFRQKLEEKEVEMDDFEAYCEKLKSRIEDLDLMVYPVESEADAVRIFEVVNDRGRHLTELEKTKSFLMHQLYLNIPDDEEGLLKERLEQVRDYFGEIYALIDKINDHSNASNLDEDRVQRYHYILWDTEWTTSRTKRYYQNHLDHLKEKFREYNSDAVVEEAINYTRELRDSFHAVKDLVYRETDNKEVDRRLERLFVLGRLANFYPLLIASWLHYDRDNEFSALDFNRIAEKVETFIFRVYSAQQRPGNTGRTRFYPLGRTVYQGKRDADDVVSKLADHIHYYCNDDQLLNVLQENKVYSHYGNRKGELRYLLYFYEQSLETELEFDLTDFVNNEADEEITVEHIWPQSAEKLELSESEKKMHDEYKHRLGNLALMTGSWNSSESNQPFTKKRDRYSESKIRMLNEVAAETDWSPSKIENREERMLEFVLERWPDAKAEKRSIFNY